MAFTRFKYDDARVKKELQEMTFANRYIMNTPGQGTDLPYIEDPHIRLQKWGANLRNITGKRTIVDIASDLDGRNRGGLGRDGCSKKLESQILGNNTSAKSYRTKRNITDETRASHPSWLYRDLEQTRWEYPLLDPQENVCKHFENNVSTRILEKDYHKPQLPMHIYKEVV